MRKRQASQPSCPQWVILLSVVCFSSVLAYIFLSPFFAASPAVAGEDKALAHDVRISDIHISDISDSCCRGVKNLELWGKAIVWGDAHRTNTSKDCCRACKAICSEDKPCRCNSWVYCDDEEKCKDKFQQCWLKHQNDPLNPELQASGTSVMWTSGLVYGKDAGVVGIETQHGTIRIKLLVDCAPYSVAYILELQKLRHCVGCQIFRAEGRGSSWNEQGDRIGQTPSAGPYALVQGTLALQTTAFVELPIESCPVVQRGSVGWIGGGPDFFISLANHDEWRATRTVFAQVLKEDMHIVEKIAALPTVASTWSGVNVALLRDAVPLKIIAKKNDVV